MAKTRTQFLCNSCGSVHPKWMGKCPDCGKWDSLEEYKAPTPDVRAASRLATSAQTADLTRGAPLRFVPRAVAPLACPRCESIDTERLAAFGATACKALWRCRACGEPFEHFKAI